AALVPGDEAARLCVSTVTNGGVPALDPLKVAGRIVVCDRGINARVDKSVAVFEAGGIGMVLANTSPNSLNADFHSVPTVHITDTDAAAVKSYVAGASSPTGTIGKSITDLTVAAPFTADFSSRGPLEIG